MTQRFILLFFFLSTSLFSQTQFQLEKLEDFSIIYGVVRYFHPSDEASAVDWKNLGAYGVEEILKLNTQSEFENKLKEIFLPVAPSISFVNNYYTWSKKSKYPVYWVHNGLGIESKSSNYYDSQRFNKSKAPSGLKSLALFLPIEVNEGKGVKLTYEARTDGGNAYGYLSLLNSDNENLFVSSDNENPVTSKNWVRHEITTADFKHLSNILIGVFSEGGDSQFRKLQLFIQKDSEWVEIDLPPFTNAGWFPEPKGKYVEKENNLLSIKEIAWSDQLHNLDVNIPENKYYNVKLSNNLNVVVPTLVYADEHHTTPHTDSTALENLQQKIRQAKEEGVDRNYYVANTIITWNIFKHFYPYAEEINIDWKNILVSALKESFNNKNEMEHKLTLEKLTENFVDGHININNKKIDLKKDELYSTPIKFKFIGNDLVVAKVFKGFDSKIRKGDIIAEINNVPTTVFMDSLSKYISGSKQLKKAKAITRINTGAKDSQLSVKTKGGYIAHLQRIVQYENAKDFFESGSAEKCKKIDNKIYYINLNKLSDKNIDSLVPIINKYKGLIIDLRGYPKDLGHRLISYIPVVDTTKWMCRLKFVQPDLQKTLEECNGYRLNMKKASQTLNTQNVLLVDSGTISNGEFLAQFVKQYKIATIVGQPSAGVNGNINRTELLKGFSVLFTGMRVKNPDGSQFNSIGVIPDIIVNEELKNFKKGNDNFIERAVEYLNSKI